MRILAVGVEDEAGRPRFVVELDAHGDFKRQFRRLVLCQTKRPAAEATADATDQDAAPPLLPGSAKERQPVLLVNAADGEPAVEWHRVRLFQQRFESVDFDCEGDI